MLPLGGKRDILSYCECTGVFRFVGSGLSRGYRHPVAPGSIGSSGEKPAESYPGVESAEDQGTLRGQVG